MKKTKKHIYFVPGLAASSKIFEYLKLPEEDFELHYIEWLVPLSENEKIEDYALRMANQVIEENPILIGVSFGGIMVQEMGKHLNNAKIVIISSVKCRDELPKRLKLIQATMAYKLFPAGAISNLEDFSVFAFGDFAKKRIDLYKKYLSVRDESYLHWSIYNVLHWKNEVIDDSILHIHGVEDHVFPIKHIENCISIKNGTHIMILDKAKTISKILLEHI
ncbi:Pimeloyl-ACP methyl ester carboxylesterase [Lutibacter oricola]|uniref:Pimeloyl-ACP methyl ester carboxylesterase n=1 Tax=Lutibacter oricola TaxID=762486 RepID=A0A1H3EYZ3_9FLAO|nr:alpha/beta hydrolase [Lutibacter oricola]SDX83805.1 Pimeloyl-ACP methyl ester carboxylesterase [Lutibacter oricola]